MPVHRRLPIFRHYFFGTASLTALNPAIQQAPTIRPFNDLADFCRLKRAWHISCYTYSMLKITSQIEEGIMTLGLEGKLAGPWVKELDLYWRAATHHIYPVRVDLSSVTFIDEEGKDLLKKMYREGAELAASGCLNKCIVEGIMRSEKKEA